MKPDPNDYADARTLIAQAIFEGSAAGGVIENRHQHDQAELECGESHDPCLRWNRPDLAYWVETGSLLREYLALQAGAVYSDTLRQGFIDWLKRSPAERQQFEKGDDMARAALIDWYLSDVR